MKAKTVHTKSEHITALFVGGLYYWFAKNDRQAADLCWRTALDIKKNCMFININVNVTGEA